MKDKVTHLNLPDRGNQKAQFKIVNKDVNFCKHTQVTVDEDDRIINCTGCGKALDPFDWILRIANKEESIFQHAKRVDDETNIRRKAITELKRIETNYKGRIRNLKKKLNDSVVDDIEYLIATMRNMHPREIPTSTMINKLKKIMSKD